jgi:hypothetical protein
MSPGEPGGNDRRQSGPGGAVQTAVKRKILLAMQKLTDRDTLDKGVEEITVCFLARS